MKNKEKHHVYAYQFFVYSKKLSEIKNKKLALKKK